METKKEEIQISKEERKIVNKIQNIDYVNNLLQVVENPHKFFEPYIEQLKSPEAILFARGCILTILRKINTSKELTEEIAPSFLNKYPIEKYLNIMLQFYEYLALNINYFLDNYENITLDLFNDKKITKEQMGCGLKYYSSIKIIMEEEKRLISETIKDYERRDYKG